MKQSTRIYPVSRGAWFPGEKNDCTVRALSNAKQIPYLEAHEILKRHGRKERHGAFISVFHPAYVEAGFEVQGVFGTTLSARVYWNALNQVPRKFPGITLDKAMDIFEKFGGNYIVMMREHAFAVVDGDLIETGALPGGTSVAMIYKLKTV